MPAGSRSGIFAVAHLCPTITRRLNEPTHMRWQLLPPELLAHVLARLSLPQLRLVKAVSRATANTCRRVLRSDEWCVDANWYHMQEELKAQYSSYKLPMTVSMFDEDFDDGHQCIATVHRLKLGRMNAADCELLDTRNVEECWSVERLDDKSIDTIILDICIEIHGRGIAGSEYMLRRMIQDAMREHGNENAIRLRKADKIHTAQEEARLSGEFRFGMEAEQMSLTDLLFNICPATEITKGYWEVHDAPHSAQSGRESCPMTVLTMCGMGLRLFV